MAEGNGEVAVRDPDALLAEIERTRLNLARTIDALTERASPGNLARRAGERAREQAQQALDRVREQAQRPEVQRAAAGIAAGAVVLGAVAFWLRRRNR
jgi:hypothetical protein